MHLDRREFLAATFAGTAGLLLTDPLAAAPTNPDPTALVPLGKELKVTRIGFGTGMAGWLRESTQTKLGVDEFDRLLRYAYDQNIRLFDMADLYGTHSYVARAMRGKPRDSYTLATKIWGHPNGLQESDRPDADVCVYRFLKELNTDHIDLVQLHCQMNGNWTTEMRKQMDLLEDLKRKGVIRAHGASIHSIEAMKAAAVEPWVDVIHARVNIYQHRTDGPMEKVVPLIQKVHAAGKGVIAMKLIGEGTLDAQQRKENLRFALGLDCLDAMIVGFEKTDHIDEFKAGVANVLAAKK